ncbi:MAG: PH domain-containing protein [Erysipelotrichales bacterium]|nr:PH domain-containing protein [Erysipelotrichales bacterium]
MNEEKQKIIDEKRKTTVDNPEFNIVWEGQPDGLLGTILSTLHLNFTKYQISKDELIITKGFFSRRTDTVELYLLKDPDLRETLWQRLFKVGTIGVKVDSHSNSFQAGRYIEIKNIKKCYEVRKLLRDYIEADVVERGINYFDKV